MRVVLALALAIAAAGADPRPAAFVVGALRRDGVVIPFATFDGRRWSNRWPAPELNPTIPITVDSVPSRWWGPAGPRATWQAWTEGRTRDVHVTQLEAVDVQCTRQVGLHTDYRGDAPPPESGAQPYPKDGLAVSPPQRIERIAVLAPLAPELQPMTPTLRDAFNKAERDTASRFGSEFNRDFRERADPEIEAAYAFGAEPRVYYVESARAYRQMSGQTCAIAFGTGWFARGGGRFAPLAMTVDLLPCSKYGATYMYPFGAMTLGGRTYWLAQFSGWDHERFVVIEATATAVTAVVNTWGGGC